MSDYSPAEIETAVGWWGKPGDMIEAMVAVGWLEPDGTGWRVHDWLEHQGHIAAFKAKAKAMASARWNAARNAVSIAEHPPPALPHLTVPTDPTKAFKRLGKCSGEKNGENGEGEFILAARDVFGKEDMGRNGGMWRTLYRQNSGKAKRVLDEVKATLRERPAEIRTTPAQFAMDLWKRFK